MKASDGGTGWTMNCSRVRNGYEAYVADDLSAARAAQFDEHLARCPACRQWFEIQEAGGEALRALAEASLPPASYFQGLYQRVAPRLERTRRWERVRSAAWTPIQAFFISAAAPARLIRASALCCVGLWLGLSFGSALLRRETGPVQAGIPIELSALDEIARLAPGMGPEATGVFFVDKSPREPQAEIRITVAPPRLIEMPTALEAGMKQAEQTWIASPALAHEVYETAGRAGEQWMGQLREAQALAQPEGLTVVSVSPPGGQSSGAAQGQSAAGLSERASTALSFGRKLRESSVFEDLQGLKFDLFRSGQTGPMREVERLEKALSALSEFQGAEEAADYRRQMQLYQEAQQAYVKGDYFQAEAKYLDVVRISPGSRWACIARYELGNLDYEVNRQFETARQYYRKCLEEYPPEHLSELQRRQAVERLEALELYRADGYRPLSLYLAAASSEPAKAEELYLELTLSYPGAPVARQAVEELIRLATEDPMFSAISGQAILEEFLERLRRDPTGPLAAHYQFGVAEMRNRLLEDFREAQLDYARAAQMTGDPVLRARAGEQLRLLRWREGADSR